MVLEGKVALVTGSSKGIGRAIAVALARAGADVGVNYNTDPAGAEATCAAVREAGRSAVAVQADVSDRAAAERLVGTVAERLGRLDVLVNNAALLTGHGGSFVDWPPELWRRVMAVNLDGPVHCMQFALRTMLERGEGGRIVNLSSARAILVGPKATAYVAAKAGLTKLSQALAVEFGPQGITVNVIAPGAVMTPGMQASPEGQRRWIARSPVGRMGLPEDIAGAVVYLASPAASYVNGQVIAVDGGYVVNGTT